MSWEFTVLIFHLEENDQTFGQLSKTICIKKWEDMTKSLISFVLVYHLMYSLA